MPGRSRSWVGADSAGLCSTTMYELSTPEVKMKPPGHPSPSFQPSRRRIQPQSFSARERSGTQISMWCTAAAIGALSLLVEATRHRHRDQPRHHQPCQRRDQPRPPVPAGRGDGDGLAEKAARRGEDQHHQNAGDRGLLGHSFIVRADRHHRSDTGVSRVRPDVAGLSEGGANVCGDSRAGCSDSRAGGMVSATRIETTAYGAAALERLQDVVAGLKSDDPMKPVTLLLPNNLAGVAARRFLAQSGTAGLFLATL